MTPRQRILTALSHQTPDRTPTDGWFHPEVTDVLNPIQPECMDPVEVRRRWGDRITLHACISIRRTLPFGSPADVRREVEALIRQCGLHGGLILMPSNNIQPDTPLENIIACYHAARDFELRAGR